MKELENKLNDEAVEQAAGGTMPVSNAVAISTSGGGVALHSTPENVLYNEIPGSKLSNGEIVIRTGQVKNNMTYVYSMKNGANGWIDNSCLPGSLSAS